MLTRRCFLRNSALAAVGFGTVPRWLLAAKRSAANEAKILIAIFQRGAADGLNIVPPFFEKAYYQARPSIAVPLPGRDNGALDLDGRFGLNPALDSLKPLWDDGTLAVVHAAGSPDPNRSHFEAQDFMECGTPGRISDDGWLNRVAPETAAPAPLRAISVGASLPRTLRGPRSAVAISEGERFKIANQGAASAIENMYATSGDRRLAGTSVEIFDALKQIEAIGRLPYRPVPGSQYVGEFGRGLQQIARLIKGGAGVEVAFADIGGWDHHTNEIPQLTNRLREFGTSLAAFVRDMGDRMENIVIVTMSEFGRTVRESGNGGTDHGHGNVMFVLGGPVHGSRVYGAWPGLEAWQLFENRDLAVTTDFRTVLGELVERHLGQQPDNVFPGFSVSAPLGILKTG